MSWLLKQAEDILNRVDQQTNAALHQPNSKLPPTSNQMESIPDTPSFTPSIPLEQPLVNRIPSRRESITPTRRINKTDESELINYLNSSATVNTSETKKSVRIGSSTNKTRTSSSSSIPSNDHPLVSSHNNHSEVVLNIPSSEEAVKENSEQQLIASLRAQLQILTRDKQHYENDLEVCKRQQTQYQQQIAESDALLRDLRARQSDSMEVLLARDSQIALLRARLAETDGLLQTKVNQYEQLHNEYSRILENPSNIQSQSSDFLKQRISQMEQELERNSNENERFMNENQQLIEQLKSAEKRLNDEHLQFYEQQQQTKHAKNTVNQLEQDMNEYKAKAQRILQAKDKLIIKLKDIIQHRSSTPTIADQHENETNNTHDDSTLLNISLVGNPPMSSLSSLSTIPSNWATIQYEEIKSENDLFKQELQARELTIHTLRNEVQEAELLLHQTDEQFQAQTNQLNEQLKDERSRLMLIEQDYRKLKQDTTSMNDKFHQQKQIYQGQINERESEIERLRSQLTSKTINHVNDDELEKRLQMLTESLIHKQTIIETLQTDKSSLAMQLERLEKRLDDYDTITSNNSFPQSSKIYSTTSIPIDDNDHYENLRYRMPLLRETPYDVDLTKKVKRAANELDKLGIRLTIFLRRYPIVRLGVLFYVVLLHLWTFIVLFTYTPEAHSNTNPINVKDKL